MLLFETSHLVYGFSLRYIVLNLGDFQNRSNVVANVVVREGKNTSEIIKRFQKMMK